MAYNNLMDTFSQLGRVALIAIVLYFIVFVIGLARVFHQAGIPVWKAFVPAINFMFMVDMVGLPRKFFWYSLIPYVGAVYAFAVMARIAKAYGKGLVFTSIWLTFATAVGIHILLFEGTLNKSVWSEPAPNIESLRRSKKKQIKSDSKT